MSKSPRSANSSSSEPSREVAMRRIDRSRRSRRPASLPPMVSVEVELLAGYQAQAWDIRRPRTKKYPPEAKSSPLDLSDCLRWVPGPVKQGVWLERVVVGGDLGYRRGRGFTRRRMPSFAGLGVGCSRRGAIFDLSWAGRSGVQLRVFGGGESRGGELSTEFAGATTGSLTTG
jgi:hypothetical protein